MKNLRFAFGLSLALCILGCTILSVDTFAQKKPAGRPAGGSRPATSIGNSPKSKPSATSQKQKTAPSNRDLGSKKGEAGNNGNFNNNKVNIDKSRGDVNINVDNSKDIKINNSRNTNIRANTYRPYTRPPVVYGGFHFRVFYPYYYHPYRPFYWGPVWHPWGFFIATLTATAIIVSFADVDIPPQIKQQDYYAFYNGWDISANGSMRSGPSITYYPQSNEPDKFDSGKEEYYYDQGVFYLKGNGGYTSVAGPIGAIVKTLPKGYETVELDEAGTVKNYYWGGTFYEKISSGYKVVPPTSGAVIEHLAEGGEEVKMGDVTYVKIGETYYQPIQKNGKNMYEVVNAEKVD